MKKVLLLILLLAPSFVFANENLYKEKWCKDKRGKLNQVIGGVTVDCLTKNHAVEVSKLTTWEDIISKADALRLAAPGKRAGIVVIYNKKKYLELTQLKAVAKSMGITVWTLDQDYIKPKYQPVKKTVRAPKSKKNTSSRKSYFTPHKKPAQSSRPPVTDKPVNVRPQIIIKTVTKHTVIRSDTSQQQKPASKPTSSGRRNIKPWLGDGIIDRLR
jgi:hypothetical protein